MNNPSTAPQDGTQFLGDFGYPWLQAAAWCAASESWAVATLQASHDQDDNNERDVWFETEYEKQSALRGWIPLPVKPQSEEPATAQDCAWCLHEGKGAVPAVPGCFHVNGHNEIDPLCAECYAWLDSECQ